MRKPKNGSGYTPIQAKTIKNLKANNILMKMMGVGEQNLRNIENENIDLIEDHFIGSFEKGFAPPKEDIDTVQLLHMEKFNIFVLKHAIYGMPNAETIKFLEDEIGEDKSLAMEICAGNGWFSKLLGIRAVDNYIQQRNSVIKEFYINGGQPPIKYVNDHVEEIDAMEGIKKYRPKIVFGSYITDKKIDSTLKGGSVFSIQDWEMFYYGVEKYIVLCSEGTHDDKKILTMDGFNIKRVDGIASGRNPTGTYLLVITKK